MGNYFEAIFMQKGIDKYTAGRIFKKVQAKKLVKSNKSCFFS